MKRDFNPTLTVEHLMEQIKMAVMIAKAYADNLDKHTAENLGYLANGIQQQHDLSKVLEYLANAVLLDKVAMLNLTQSNLTLAKQLERVQEELQELNEELTKKNNMKENNKYTCKYGNYEVYYCWSH
eukprot:8235847-Ditylum_brightwellii.AAC.1